jgi:peptidoglycan hydrolase-like protein with peptidoglycan-binding domain
LRSYVSVLIAAMIAMGPATTLSSGTPKHSTRKKTSSSGTTKKKGATSKKRRPSAVRASPGWRASQQAPTPDRYKEIQQALMQRGYLSGAASGVWSMESMEAMKRFQRDQNLTPSGKPSSLSLIALGLGPKRDLSTQNGQSRQGLPP